MKKILFIITVLSISFFFDMKIYGAEEEYLSEDIISYTEEIGETYNICPELLQAIIEAESSGNKDAFNGKCVGLMQIYPKYHVDRMERLEVTSLYDSYSNILIGADYLAELFEEYEDLYPVLMVYNMGQRRALELYYQDKFSSYAVSICERAAELEELYEKNIDRKEE